MKKLAAAAAIALALPGAAFAQDASTQQSPVAQAVNGVDLTTGSSAPETRFSDTTPLPNRYSPSESIVDRIAADAEDGEVRIGDSRFGLQELRNQDGGAVDYNLGGGAQIGVALYDAETPELARDQRVRDVTNERLTAQLRVDF